MISLNAMSAARDAAIARERRHISAALRADRVVDCSLVEYATSGCRRALRHAIYAADDLARALKSEAKRKRII